MLSSIGQSAAANVVEFRAAYGGVLFRIMLTAVHGASVMRLCDRLAPGEDGDAIAHDALEAVLIGLRAGSPITSSSVACVDFDSAQ